jgi:hypothetical protein
MKIRFDRDTVRVLDDVADAVRQKNPGRRVSRQGIARELLLRAVRDRRLVRQVGA